MQEINISEILFQPLKNDYENSYNQQKLQSGFDYMESIIKFIGILSISIVKKIDIEIYNKILMENFKLTPSLGDYKSLATQSFLKQNIKINKNNSNSFFIFLEELFREKDLFIEVIMAEDILNNNLKYKKILTLWNLLEEYVVNFRNKIKGHGASFRNEDKEQSLLVLKNLEEVINFLEIKLNKLLSSRKLNFYIISNDNLEKEHNTMDVIVKYEDELYCLAPFLVYLECKKFSCKENHRTKIFFYNDGKASKSYYLDYSFNHYYFFSENNGVDDSLKQIKNLQPSINFNDTSDNNRLDNLMEIFIGRENELFEAKKHIDYGIKNNVSTIMTIIGKPGSGKSAFISKLISEIKYSYNLENRNFCSYIFYVKKLEMTDDEINFFYNKLAKYLSSIGIRMPKFDLNENVSYLEKLEEILSSINLPFIFVIDGLDEFKKSEDFIQNFPLSKLSNNIHIIFSSREYDYILQPLKDKIFNTNIKILNEDNYMKNLASIKLGFLERYNVNILIDKVLTKDLKRDSLIYQEIQDEIYKKSEGWPLYVHYISDMLVEFNPSTDDIKIEILEYSKQLPSGLDNFYFTLFKNLDSISSQILYILYFSVKNVSFESFYQIIIKLNSLIDRKEFQNKYFSNIEIFLKKEGNKYNFYHLSIKEAIKDYFKNRSIITNINKDSLIYSNGIKIDEEFDFNIFKDFYYLKENSDLFEFLYKLKSLLLQDKNDKNLFEYFQANIIHIFNQYLWFSIFHENITYREEKLLINNRLIVSKKISDLINKLHLIFDDIKNPTLEEIEIAYKFSIINNNYEKILDYYTYNSNYFIKFLTKILAGIKNPKIQKYFEEFYFLFTNLLDDNIKYILIHSNLLANYEKIRLLIKDSIEDEELKTLSRRNRKNSFIKSEPLINNLKKMLNLLDSSEYYIYKQLDSSEIKTYSDEKLIDIVINLIREISIEKDCFLLIKKFLSNIILKEIYLINNMISLIRNSKFYEFQIDELYFQFIKVCDIEEQAFRIYYSIKSEIYRAMSLVIIGEKFKLEDKKQDGMQMLKSIDLNSLSDINRQRILDFNANNEFINLEVTEEQEYVSNGIIGEHTSIENSLKIVYKMFDYKKKYSYPSMHDKRMELEQISDKLIEHFDFDLLFKGYTYIKNEENKNKFLRKIANELNNFDDILGILKEIDNLKIKDLIIIDNLHKINQEQFFDIFKMINQEINKFVECSIDIGIELNILLNIIENIDEKYEQQKVLEYLGKNYLDKKHDELFNYIKTIKNKDERIVYILKGLIKKESRFDRLIEFLEVLKAIDNNFIKEDLNQELILKLIDNCFDIEYSLNLFEQLDKGENRAKAYISMANNLNDKSFYIKAIDEIELIAFEPIKIKLLIDLYLVLGNKELYIKAINILKSKWSSISKKSFSCEYILEKVELSLENSLEIISLISSSFSKDYSFGKLALKQNNLNIALDILDKIKNNDIKYRVYKDLMSKFDDEYTIKIIEKLLKNITVYVQKEIDFDIENLTFIDKFKFIYNSEITNSFNYVYKYSKESILNFYNIQLSNKETKRIDLILKELYNLKISRTKFELINDEINYDSLNTKANNIKQEILNDVILLRQFIEKFHINELKFKKSDILDLLDDE